MDIKRITKKSIKGQAILDMVKQVKDAFNIINSVTLNIEAVIKEMKKDSDYDVQEMQEFKNILSFIIREASENHHKWLEKFYDIVIQ